MREGWQGQSGTYGEGAIGGTKGKRGGVDSMEEIGRGLIGIS